MPKGDYKNTHITKAQFLALLEEYNGNMYATAKELGLPLSRLQRWREEDEEFAKAIEKLKNVTKWWAENKLHQFIEGKIGDPQTQARLLAFYLKTQGGYTETKNINANVTGSNTVDLNVALDEIKKELETE